MINWTSNASFNFNESINDNAISLSVDNRSFSLFDTINAVNNIKESQRTVIEHDEGLNEFLEQSSFNVLNEQSEDSNSNRYFSESYREEIIGKMDEFNKNDIKSRPILIFNIVKVPHNKLLGRKKKHEIRKVYHDKFSKDNIIRKIKTKFFNYMYDIINKNLKDKSNKINKLPSDFVANLNKDQNLKILGKTLKEILQSQKISTKYKKNQYENKIIVNKIFSNNKKTEVMKILNLTLKELFGIFRRKLNNEQDITEELREKTSGLDLLENNEYGDFDSFINNMNEKKTMDEKELDNYVESIKNLCLTYEEWFRKKVGKVKYEY